MRYKATISRGIAGRVDKSDIIEDFENPKYGFYWWFWVPKYGSNGGKFKRNECVDIDIKWLCFWFGFIFWPNQ